MPPNALLVLLPRDVNKATRQKLKAKVKAWQHKFKAKANSRPSAAAMRPYVTSNYFDHLLLLAVV